MKVVRSPSEILELIKSYDSTTLKSTPEVILSADHSNKYCDTSLKCSKDIPKTLPKHIGPKRILKSNIRGQVSDLKVHHEIEEGAAFLSNNLNKKLVLFTLSLISQKVLITIFYFRFNVTWGKQTNKKHKTWENDGYLIVSNKLVTLYVIITNH